MPLTLEIIQEDGRFLVAWPRAGGTWRAWPIILGEFPDQWEAMSAATDLLTAAGEAANTGRARARAAWVRAADGLDTLLGVKVRELPGGAA